MHLARNDLGQVLLVLGCSAKWDVVTLKIVYGGKGDQLFPYGPKTNQLIGFGWILVKSSTYWTYLQTMKNYLEEVFVPYFSRQCDKLSVDYGVQRCVLILDNYVIHRSIAFRKWLNFFPWIYVCYLPKQCTNKL